ncbi:hypothetical protein JCM10296v2_001804 [Rhodotorula toruloides]
MATSLVKKAYHVLVKWHNAGLLPETASKATRKTPQPTTPAGAVTPASSSAGADSSPPSQPLPPSSAPPASSSAPNTGTRRSMRHQRDVPAPLPPSAPAQPAAGPSRQARELSPLSDVDEAYLSDDGDAVRQAGRGASDKSASDGSEGSEYEGTSGDGKPGSRSNARAPSKKVAPNKGVLHEAFTPSDDKIILEERRKNPPTSFLQITRMLGKRDSQRQGTLARHEILTRPGGVAKLSYTPDEDVKLRKWDAAGWSHTDMD